MMKTLGLIFCVLEARQGGFLCPRGLFVQRSTTVYSKV